MTANALQTAAVQQIRLPDGALPGFHYRVRIRTHGDVMKSAFVVLAIAFLPLTLAAQQKPALTAPENSIYVGADGKYEAAPDTALVQFNISPQENTAQEAYQRASSAAEQVRQILRANQIDPRAAEIGFFSLQPVYDYRTPKRKLVGYRVNSAVTLKLKDFSKVGTIIEQLANIEVTANQNLSYVLENTDTAKTHAVQDAVRRARENAQAAAVAGGRVLGELAYASVDVFEPILPGPRPMFAAKRAEAAAAVPAPTEEFTPQNITITAHVNALFLLK
jgi:uncharacterized protein YggE